MKTYRQCCSEVAIKHRLGKSLVTGHKAGYWEEAAEMYAAQFKIKTMKTYTEDQVEGLLKEQRRICEETADYLDYPDQKFFTAGKMLSANQPDLGVISQMSKSEQ